MKKFNYGTLEEIKGQIENLGLENLKASENTDVLFEEYQLEGYRLPNRIVIQPMEGCDSDSKGAPGELTLRRYQRFAKSGAAMIWEEATAVSPEARANPRQLYICRENIDAFKQMVEEIKETCYRENGFIPMVIMQATHAGRYAKPEGVPAPIIAYNNPLFEKDAPLPASCLIGDEELFALEEKFGEAAAYAQEAGFDGVDIKACHRYLASELLSAYQRPGAFGGSFENRVRLLVNGIRNAQQATHGGFIVTSRLNVYDGFPHPYGWGVAPGKGIEIDLEEPIRLIEILHKQLHVNLLNVTIGNPYVNPYVNRPAENTAEVSGENPLTGVDRIFGCSARIQEAFPDLCVVGSGVSYLRQFSAAFAAGAVENKMATMEGFGREALAYPEFVQDILHGGMKKEKCCITCGKCTQMMRTGHMVGCMVRDSQVYMPMLRESAAC